ncbi:MAG TPA: hypothetical protein VF190_14335 [Rhodothermales bacterium]
MAHEIQILREKRLGVIRLSGYVDAAELDVAAEAQINHPDFRSDFNSVWDLRHTRTVDVSPEGFNTLIQKKLERDRVYGLTGRIAIIVNRHTIVGAALLAKIQAGRSPGRAIDVFSTEKQAMAWLHESA